MQKTTIIAAASFYNKKYFFNEECAGVPEGVREELSRLCKIGAESVKGVFSVAFDAEQGSVSFASQGDPDDFGYDEINARIVTDKLLKENSELIKSIQLWHALYVTEQGKRLRAKTLGALPPSPPLKGQAP